MSSFTAKKTVPKGYGFFVLFIFMGIVAAFIPRLAYPYIPANLISLVSAPFEELDKFLFFYLGLRLAYKHLTSPWIFIVAGAFVGLGYGVTENLGYLSYYGVDNFWLRTCISLPGHCLYGMLWGVGFAYFETVITRIFFLCLTVTAHLVFNYLSYTGIPYTFFLLPDAVLFMFFVLVICSKTSRY